MTLIPKALFVCSLNVRLEWADQSRRTGRDARRRFCRERVSLSSKRL